MSGTVGNMNWRACQDCKYAPKEGGCSLNMPDNLSNFVLNYDYIECTKHEATS